MLNQLAIDRQGGCECMWWVCGVRYSSIHILDKKMLYSENYDTETGHNDTCNTAHPVKEKKLINTSHKEKLNIISSTKAIFTAGLCRLYSFQFRNCKEIPVSLLRE